MSRCQSDDRRKFGSVRLVVGSTILALLSCTSNRPAVQGQDRNPMPRSDVAVAVSLIEALHDGSSSNVVVGARDVRNALNLLLAVSEGSAREEVSSFLGAGGSEERYLEGEKSRVAELENRSGARGEQVRHAACLWVRGKGGKRPEASAIGARLGAEIRTFEASPAAEIDAWVLKQSAGRVKSVFPKKLAGDVNTVAVTVGVFDGVWQEPFDAKLTRQAPFFGSGGAAEVPMMTGVRRSPLVRNEEYAALGLRFSTDGRWFVVVMSSDGSKRVLPAPRTIAGALEALFAGDAQTLVRVSMPRFEVSSNLDLAPALRRNGIVGVFDRPSIVTGLSEKEPLRLGAFQHACELKLDEKGVEAASATAQVLHSRSAREPKIEEFRVDRPFHFAVWDQPTGDVLYLGNYSDPKS
jgi:serine protease inhibitor